MLATNELLLDAVWCGIVCGGRCTCVTVSVDCVTMSFWCVIVSLLTCGIFCSSCIGFTPKFELLTEQGAFTPGGEQVIVE